MTSSCWPRSPAGWAWRTWRALFAEMYVRARGDLPDQDPGREFADREVKLATTIGGAGVMHGDLTAECAAAVAAVLDALSAPAGKEDDRTKGQRYHDALARSDAAADRQRPAAGAGRAAGQGLGAHHPGRPAPARRRLGAAAGVDGAGPGPVGRPPRGRVRDRRERRRVAGRRRRRGDRLRRRDGPDRDRRRRRGRAGGPGPALRGTGRAARRDGGRGTRRGPRSSRP